MEHRHHHHHHQDLCENHHPSISPNEYKIKFNNLDLLSSKISLLSLRYYELFLSEKYSDCSFCIDQHIIKAHKLILSAASPVFEAMLYGPLNANDNNNNSNNNEENTKIINVTDISPEVFYKLLTFIYIGELSFTTETLQNAIELYYCGEKYILNELKKKSLTAIKQKLSFDNILETLDLAIYSNLEPFIGICLQFLGEFCLASDNGATKFLTTIKESYYHLSKNSIMEIINSPLIGEHCKKYVYWFVKEWWLQNDFEQKKELSKKHLENSILEDDDHETNDQNKTDNICSNLNKFIENLNCWDAPDIKEINGLEQPIFIDRTYYKARQPFLINEQRNVFEVCIKSSDYKSLVGLSIFSRLKPAPLPLDLINMSSNYAEIYDYKESFKIEIISIFIDSDIQQQQSVIHTKNVNEKILPYNCNVNILLNKRITLIPGDIYIIRLSWDVNKNKGAEYPCILMSNKVGDITFDDHTTHGNGSILRGLKLLRNGANNAKK